VAILLLLLGASLLVTQWRERGGQVANPIEMVRDWLFPPPPFMIVDVDIDAPVFEWRPLVLEPVQDDEARIDD
jgi:hypothetical protein